MNFKKVWIYQMLFKEEQVRATPVLGVFKWEPYILRLLTLQFLQKEIALDLIFITSKTT